MKGKLKILGYGAVFSIISAMGVGLLISASFGLYKVAQLSGYFAVLAFLVAVLCIIGAGRIMYGIGECIKDVKK